MGHSHLQGEIGGESESRKLLQQTADKLRTVDAALKEKVATEEVLIQELESTGATLDEIQEQNSTGGSTQIRGQHRPC